MGVRTELRNGANLGGMIGAEMPLVGMGSHFNCAFLPGYRLLRPWQGLEGTGSFLLTRRRTSHYGRLTNVAPRMNPTLSPRAVLGAGRGSETSCFSASEQPFFDFRVAGGLGGVCGWDGQVIEKAAELFCKGL